ncbi:MAG: hypothetical protein AB7P03_17465 [Kofleriaceae bacterium]
MAGSSSNTSPAQGPRAQPSAIASPVAIIASPTGVGSGSRASRITRTGPIVIPFKAEATEDEGAFMALAAQAGKFPAGLYQMQIESADPRKVIFIQVQGGAIKPDGKADDGGDDGAASAGCNAGGLASSFGLLPLAALLGTLRRRRSRGA